MGPIWGMWGPKPWSCKDWYNEQLENATEADKAGSSAASTIMALLPTLLSFAPIITPRIGLLTALSFTHGFIAAAFTFGLPVRQLEIETETTPISFKRLLDNVKDVQSIAEDPISPTNPSAPSVPQPFNNSTSTNQPESPATGNPDTQDTSQAIGPTSLEAGSSSGDNRGCGEEGGTRESVGRPLTVEDVLSSIKKKAFNRNCMKRIQVLLLMYISTVIHFFLIWSLAVILLFVDPSNVIWLCPGNGVWTMGWLFGVFAIVGIFRSAFELHDYAITEVIYINKAKSNQSDSATRWNRMWARMWVPPPTIVMLRVPPTNSSGSDKKQKPLGMWFFGILQLCWLMYLSFYFSSMLGGALFRTLLTVSAFIFVVAISRGLSILTNWLVVKHIGLTVIECDNREELRQWRRCISALSRALVEVRGMRVIDHDRRETYEKGQRDAHRDPAAPVCTNYAHKVGTRSPYDEAITIGCASITVWASLGYVSAYLMSTIGNSHGTQLVNALILMLYPILVTAMGIVLRLSEPKGGSVTLCNCEIIDAPP